MSESKLCCNCLHCARWKKSSGIECHCDLDDRRLGYLDVMDDENDCPNWEKETIWDEQAKHDAQIKEEAIKEFVNILKRELNPCTGNYGIGFNYSKMCEFLDLYETQMVERVQFYMEQMIKGV